LSRRKDSIIEADHKDYQLHLVAISISNSGADYPIDGLEQCLGKRSVCRVVTATGKKNTTLAIDQKITTTLVNIVLTMIAPFLTLIQEFRIRP